MLCSPVTKVLIVLLIALIGCRAYSRDFRFGNRVEGDELIAFRLDMEYDLFSFLQPTVKRDYRFVKEFPDRVHNKSATITCIEIIVKQLNSDATPEVVITSGGVGKKQATVVLELKNAKSYDVDISIYGKSASTVVNLHKFTMVLVLCFSIVMPFK